MFVRPAAGHAAYDCQSVFRRCATMFTCLWLPDAQLGMLAALPVYDKHNLSVDPGYLEWAGVAVFNACAVH